MKKQGIFKKLAAVILSAAVASLVPISASAENTALIFGDVDEDNSITAGDALLVLRHSADMVDIFHKVGLGQAVNKVFADGSGTSYKRIFGDVDGDEQITASDALAILRASAGFDDGNMIGEEETFSAVMYDKREIIAPESIRLSDTSLTLDIDETATLSAIIGPGNATDKSVRWESSNTNIVTVSNGTVKAVSAGTAVVTAKTSNNLAAVCSITVNKPDGLTLLIDHIEKKGAVNSGGNKYVNTSIVNNGNNYTLSIIYDKSNSAIVFYGILTSSEFSGDHKTNLRYTYKDSNVKDTEKTTINSYTVTCTASYSSKTIYKGQNISYKVENDPGLSQDELDTLSNVPRDLALVTAQGYLAKNLGIALGDIGFDQYEKLL